MAASAMRADSTLCPTVHQIYVKSRTVMRVSPYVQLVFLLPSFVFTFREALLDISKIGNMLNLAGTMP